MPRYTPIDVHSRACETLGIPGVSSDWLNRRAGEYRMRICVLRSMRAPEIVVAPLEFLASVYNLAAQMIR